tara:strand:+ start:1546 stop:2100 length:555 start_codon:yes stop_codon:yes gene_type:complete
MEDSNLNIDPKESTPIDPEEIKSMDDSESPTSEGGEDKSTIAVAENLNEKSLDRNVISEMSEPEYVYSLIESAVPNKNGFRKNISKRDFALWVLPIVAINTIRRFTSRNTSQIVQPYEQRENNQYLIKGTETVYTNTKSVFEGKERMRFFGFRFISIWVFPMAVTGAFMEFLFVAPLNGTNPFG